jgi:hypothetical protein
VVVGIGLCGSRSCEVLGVLKASAGACGSLDVGGFSMLVNFDCTRVACPNYQSTGRCSVEGDERARVAVVRWFV